MKKLIAILVVFAVVAGAAFAQIAGGMYVNAWGTGTFAPLIIETAPQIDGKVVKDFDDEDLGARSYVGVGPEWGGNTIETGFNIGGWSENIGWGVSMGGFGDGFWSSGEIWARPFGNDYLKITIGDYTDDTLRGKIGVGSPMSGFVMMSYGGGEDSIFHRIGTDTSDGVDTYYSGQGFMFTSIPYEGVLVMLNVNTQGNLWSPADWAWGETWAQNIRTNDAYRAMQVAVGYNLAGIGLARVQWIGGWFGTFDMSKEDTVLNIEKAAYGPADKQAAIQAAFNLTAIENLDLDIGIKYTLPVTFKDDVTFTPGMTLGLGANYSMDDININLHSYVNFGGYERAVKDDKSADGLDFGVFLTPSYELDFGKVGLDIAYRMGGIGIKDADGKDVEKQSWSQMGFGVWVEKGLGSGEISAGVSVTLPMMNDGKANGSMLIQVPITLTYAFF